MRSRYVSLLAAALLIGSSTAFAAATTAVDTIDAARERQRIAAERATAEARYTQQERECAQRFVVTSCTEDAKRERRETLTRLRREQNQLDDNLRKARAAERAEELRRRAAEAEGRQDPRAGAPREPHRRASPEPSRRPERTAEAASASAPKPSRVFGPRRPPSEDREAERSQQEARSRATFDAAHREAEAHRAEVERRNAERAAKRKPAAPLPLPPGASAP